MRVVFLFFMLMISHAYADNPQKQSDDKVIAIINNEKIYQSNIDIIIRDLQRTGTIIDEKSRKTLMNRLIEQKMVAQYATKNGYSKRDDVQKQIQVMTEMVLKDSYLTDLVHKEVTEDAVKKEFDKQMASFRPEFEYKAAHILVDTEEKANKIKDKLDNGEDFSKLAKEYSSDGNADTGGDLGFFSKDMMVKPFSDMTARLKIGQFSEPVQTDFGWHIIKLNDTRPLPKPTFEQLRPQIEAHLSREVINKHIEEMKQESKIIFP